MFDPEFKNPGLFSLGFFLGFIAGALLLILL
jgi:hypothetical protein